MGVAGIYRYYQTSGHPLEYATCDCGESRSAALRKKLVNGRVKCRNCTSPRTNKAFCVICEQTAPLERHHVAGHAHKMTVTICINCHACISFTQLQHDENQNTSLFYGWLYIIVEFIRCAILRNDELQT